MKTLLTRVAVESSIIILVKLSHFLLHFFLKAISKAPITLVLVPIQNPIDEEQRFICTLLCGNNFSIEFIANTKNSSFINTLFLKTCAHCKINVVYEKILW